MLFVHFVGIFRAHDLVQVDKFHAAVVGNAGPDLQNVQFLTLILLHIPQKLRPGADEAHFAQEHLAQLGDFVQLGLSQEIADPGDPGIPEGGGAAADLVGVFHHAAELADPEGLAPVAAPFRPVKYGKTVFRRHQDGDNQIEGPQNHQRRAGNQNVQQPLDTAVVNTVIGFLLPSLQHLFHCALSKSRYGLMFREKPTLPQFYFFIIALPSAKFNIFPGQIRPTVFLYEFFDFILRFCELLPGSNLEYFGWIRYNQLLRIEEELGSVSEYLGEDAFFNIK